MIPTLSSSVERGDFVEKQNRRTLPMIDYELGADALNSAAADYNSYLWTAESDGSSVVVYREGVDPVTVLTDTNITQISLGFDQTMRPHIAYIAGGVCKFYWYDTLAGSMQTMTIPDGRSPRLCMDEKRGVFIASSDLILTYKVGTNVCVRVQRQRFQNEIVLATDQPGDIVIFGLNTKNRLQWKLVGAEP
ncbi:tail fiber protein [Xanthomonas phage vB_Xar_IVIA-DoCa2]|uniref:Tail fiber protein n=1 Tax=Xanthomonas phage vB_Xar_IVIA-DoCa2 TaxID=2970491 RepID=A0A976SGS2_9CAUD|nr:tail fiber protein [Xanthomonas phage vB_Xar_IVIA-DoCa2]